MFTGLAIRTMLAWLAMTHPSNQVVVPMPYQHVAWSMNDQLVGMMRQPIPLVDPDDGCNGVRMEANVILNSLPPVIGNTDFNGNGITDSQDFFDFYTAFLNSGANP